MRLLRLSIRSFRGIRELDWDLKGSTICLIGPGDSCKTTILEAIEWVLSPRWSLTISDADFHGLAASEPIRIEATIGDLPPSLMNQDKFGLELRGFGADGIHDEPEDDDDLVLTIRLTIDDSLEPTWGVINDRPGDPRSISARDRESLGLTRVGPNVERHLTWGRGSALLRLTDSTEEMGRTLAEAHRRTRRSVNTGELHEFSEAAQRASTLARSLGAGTGGDYDPGLDPAALGIGAAALGLHDGSVPVRAAGLGSRRLAALAIQRESFPQGGIVLVDEVETGLEPHRLRHLIRKLKGSEHGQVVMTTHSEIPIVELTVADLAIVLSNGSRHSVRRVEAGLQPVVRAAPDALLGKRLIICEGDTEVGLCRSLDRLWTNQRGVPPAEVGIVLVAGGGSNAASRAKALAGLGYLTSFFGDADVEIVPSVSELLNEGVGVFTWPDGLCTEQCVFKDAPYEVVLALIDRAANMLFEDNPAAVTDAIAQRLGAPLETLPDDWGSFSDTEIRDAAALTAKKQKWFKRIDLGEELGTMIVGALPNIPNTGLYRTLNALEDWAYAS